MSLSHRSLEISVHPILGALNSVPVPAHPDRQAPPAVLPFVTISREPAVDAEDVARRLIDLLNQDQPPAEDNQRWTCWDRELVEAVADKEHLSQRLIESLEDAGHSWLLDFFTSLSFSEADYGDEAHVYKRVATMIRALAQAGRVVIIGRGGAQVTRNMPGGVHVRIVAPFEFRLQNYIRQTQLRHHLASARLRELDHNRAAFYRRYWPHDPLTCERFAMTLNAADLTPKAMADVICCAVRSQTDQTR